MGLSYIAPTLFLGFYGSKRGTREATVIHRAPSAGLPRSLQSNDIPPPLYPVTRSGSLFSGADTARCLVQQTSWLTVLTTVALGSGNIEVLMLALCDIPASVGSYKTALRCSADAKQNRSYMTSVQVHELLYLLVIKLTPGTNDFDRRPVSPAHKPPQPHTIPSQRLEYEQRQRLAATRYLTDGQDTCSNVKSAKSCPFNRPSLFSTDVYHLVLRLHLFQLLILPDGITSPTALHVR